MARQEMKTLSIQRTKKANIRERFLQRPGDSGFHYMVSRGKPLLQDAARRQPAPYDRVELFRIQQTRARGFHRRRRVNGDDVILLRSAFEITSAIVNHYAGLGG